MKKLLFALSCAQHDANGSAEYTEFVFNKLVESGIQFDVFFNPDLPGNRQILSKIPDRIPSFPCRTPGEIETLIQKNGYDTVFWGSEYDTNISMPENIRPVIVIHDLRFIEVPNDKYRPLYRKDRFGSFRQRLIDLVSHEYSAKQKRKALSAFMHHPKLSIVTVSDHTRYSLLLNFTHLREDQVHVFYCPYPEIIPGEEKEAPSDGSAGLGINPDEYFLLISAGRWFKNAYRAIRALDNLASKGLLGGKKVLVLGINENSRLLKVNNRDRFITHRFLEKDALRWAYANAFALVYPSLQEGFGIPPVEAMNAGTPVIASVNASIMEISGSAPLYFNPLSIMEIENRILQFLSDSELRSRLVRQGRKRVDEIALLQKQGLDGLISYLVRS